MEKCVDHLDRKRVEVMKYRVFHGTTSPNVNFTFNDQPNSVSYFTDIKDVAAYFARMEDHGGLLPGEVATIIHAEIILNNPLVIHEDIWEDVADSCYINKNVHIENGHDGILCKNSSDCTCYVIFNESQLSIIEREFI
jgi:hypothetical protein